MKNEALKDLVYKKFKSLSNNEVDIVLTEVFTKIKSDCFPSDLDDILNIYFKKEDFGYTSRKKNEKNNISDNLLFNTILEDWIGEQLDSTLEKYREMYIKSLIRKDEIDLFYKKLNEKIKIECRDLSKVGLRRATLIEIEEHYQNLERGDVFLHLFPSNSCFNYDCFNMVKATKLRYSARETSILEMKNIMDKSEASISKVAIYQFLKNALIYKGDKLITSIEELIKETNISILEKTRDFTFFDMNSFISADKIINIQTFIKNNKP
jgi:hypothetical protein